jgi:hypothetical protein
LVELALESDLFHSPDGRAYASVALGGHRETWLLRAAGFRTRLARLFYQIEGKTPYSQAIQSALAVLEGKAHFEGPEIPVHTRIAMVDGRIYLDLADDEWQAVEITRAGWNVVRNSPVRFRRPRGLLRLPIPERRGSLEELRHFINLPDDRTWRLLVAWLSGALWPGGPYPVLLLHGEHDSAKSTTSRMLRALIDPSAAALRAEPRDLRDLMIAANNGWIIPLDNVSHLPPWLSDALCRLSTGGGFSTRELYSDDEEVIFDAQRPIILNGIEEIATREDLLDRSIISYLPHIPDDRRRPEARLWAEFNAAKPRILGALLDVTVAGLRNLPETQLPRLPRMADFAIRVTASETALGWARGTFLEDYEENRAAANDLALESSAVAPVILGFAYEIGMWTGTASDLLKLITARVDDATAKQRVWLGSARALSNLLRRLSGNLRKAGLLVTFLPRRGRTRPISLEWAGTASSLASLRSPGQGSLELTPAPRPLDNDTGDADDAALPLSPTGPGVLDAAGAADAG